MDGRARRPRGDAPQLASALEDGEEVYRLGYPNLEVRRSLNRHLFARMTGRRTDPGAPFWRGILRAFRTGDAATVHGLP